MQTSASRAVNAVSPGELRRRWAAARDIMCSRNIDALVIQNSSDWVGGYIRWFTNQPATNGYSSAVVFPIAGGMSFIEQGPFDGCRTATINDRMFVHNTDIYLIESHGRNRLRGAFRRFRDWNTAAGDQ